MNAGKQDGGGEGLSKGVVLGGVRLQLDSVGHSGDHDFVTLWSYRGLTFATSPPPSSTIQLLAVYPDKCKAMDMGRYQQHL